MALGTNQNTTTTAAKYIPELWSDEVIAAYKSNLVLANLITKYDHSGKKGSVLHIPNFTRSSASAKSANTQVTLVAPTHTETTITINKHFEYSVVIEDIVATQALDSLRNAYTDDAGFALAKQIDTDLTQLGRGVNGLAGNNTYATHAFIGGDGTTAYVAGSNNENNLTDAGIRRTIQRLDENSYPLEGRFLTVPPSQRNALMGIARFTEQAFVGEVAGGNTIRNGQIGSLYGVPVYVTNQCDTTSGSANARVCILGHKSFAGLATQVGVRSQTQYKQEYLGDLFTADTLYGVAELRNDGAFVLIVPA